jgi:hypothetical protein
MRFALQVANITRGLHECGQRREAARHATVWLREPALADINFWTYRLGKQNGLPINDSGSEVHVTMEIQSVASDVGYGGIEGSRVHDELQG